MPRVVKYRAVTLAVVGSVTATGEPITGKVVGVTDGDTLTVLIDRQPIKVRLAEIDTPESGQPWASRAKHSTDAPEE